MIDQDTERIEHDSNESIEASKNDTHIVDKAISTDETKLIDGLNAPELQKEFLSILKDLLEIENKHNSLDKNISDNTGKEILKNEIDRFNDIRYKFKELLEACIKCEDFIRKTANDEERGKISANEKKEVEDNFRNKLKYIDDIMAYLIEQEKRVYQKNNPVKDTLSSRYIKI